MGIKNGRGGSQYLREIISINKGFNYGHNGILYSHKIYHFMEKTIKVLGVNRLPKLILIGIIMVIHSSLWAQGGADCGSAVSITGSGTYTADFSEVGNDNDWFSYTFPADGTITISPNDCDAGLFLDWKYDCNNSITNYFFGCGLNNSTFKESFSYLGTANETIYIVLDEVPDFDDPPINFTVALADRNDIDSTVYVTARSYTHGDSTFSTSGYYEYEYTFTGSMGQDSLVYLKLTIDTNYGTTYNNPEPAEDGEISVDNQNLNYNWFYYEAPQDGILVVSTCGYTSADTKIDIYDENSSVTPVASSDDSYLCGNQSKIFYEVSQNDPIWIRFDGLSHGVNEVFNAYLETRDNIAGSWYGNPIAITEGVHTANHASTEGDVYYSVDLMEDWETVGLRLSTCNAATENTSFEVYFDDFGGSLMDPIWSSETDGTICGTGLDSLEALDLEGNLVIIRFKDEAATASYDFEMTNISLCEAWGWENDISLSVIAPEYFVFGNDTLTSTGSYIDTQVNNFGCDSTINLNLTIIPSDCNNPVTYNEGNHKILNTNSDYWVKYVPSKNGTLTVQRTDNINQYDIGLSRTCEEELIESGWYEDYLVYGVKANEEYLVFFETVSLLETQYFDISLDTTIHGHSCDDPMMIDSGAHEAPIVDINFYQKSYYGYTFDQKGTVTFTTCGLTPGHDPYMRIYSTDCELIADIDGNDLNCASGGHETWSVDGNVGDTVVTFIGAHLSVSEYPHINFEVQFTPNSCENASVLSSDSTFLVNNLESHDWFQYTATQDGYIQIRTCDLTNKDTYVIFYEEDCTTQLIANDDACGLQSKLTHEVSNGQTIKIKFDNVYNIGATYQASIEFYEEAKGISCSEPIAIDSAGTYTSNNELGDQWFRFIFPADGEVTISSCDLAEVDTKLDIQSDCDTKLVCDDDSCGEQETISRSGQRGDTILFVWGDSFHSTAHEFEVLFDPSVIVDGESINNPIIINNPGLHQVDHALVDTANVWWKVTAEFDGYMALDMRYGGSGEVRGKIYYESADSLMDEMDLNIDVLYVDLDSGKNYYMEFDMSQYNEIGNYNYLRYTSELVLIPSLEAKGNRCDNTITLTDDGLFPVVHDQYYPDWFTGQYYDIHYSYTPADDGLLTVSTCGTSLIDTRILLYEAGCAGDPLVSSDYDCGEINNKQSEISYQLAAGQEYIIVFDDSGADQEVYMATFDFTPGNHIVWNNQSWSNVTGPVSDQDTVVIADDYNTVLNGEFLTGPFSIRNGRSLTINPGDQLDVNGDFENYGEVVIESGASLLTYDQYSYSGNDIRFERTTRFATAGYSMMGSPVQSDAGNSGNLFGPVVYGYDESIPYDEATNDGINRWVNASTTVIQPGHGYAVAGALDIAIEGIPNDGDINLTGLSRTEDATTGTENWGWHLLSNPYPAAIDINAFIAENTDIEGFVALWDDPNTGTRGSNGDYLIVNAIGTVTGPNGGQFNGHIGSMQGFFVQVGDGQAGNVSFTESMRVSGNNADGNFFRQERVPSVKISISQKDLYSETLIGFPEDAIVGESRLYDAPKLKAQEEFNIYSLLNDKPYAIQGLPINDLITIPLGLDIRKSGQVKVSIKETSVVFDKFHIYLNNQASGQTIEFNSDHEVVLNMSEGVNQQNLSLVIEKHAPLQNNKLNIIKVYVDEYHIIVGDQDTTYMYTLYDLNGRVINAGTSERLIDKPMKSGIYILQLQDGTHQESHKLLID